MDRGHAIPRHSVKQCPEAPFSFLFISGTAAARTTRLTALDSPFNFRFHFWSPCAQTLAARAFRKISGRSPCKEAWKQRHCAPCEQVTQSFQMILMTLYLCHNKVITLCLRLCQPFVLTHIPLNPFHVAVSSWE